MKYIVVIPARMASTRLPGKPLIDLLGKTMIQRTYEQCIKVITPDLVYVATDDNAIMEHCFQLGINAILTSPYCLTGTDRIAEVATKIKADYYINVQGDEPVMNPVDILKTIEAINLYPNEVICGYAPIYDEEQFNSRSIPKMVFSPDGNLLYMSRSPIPGNKKEKLESAWRQICVYAFPYRSLIHFASFKEKTPLESIEDLELLRFLESGVTVKAIELSADSIAIDTEEDVKKVIEYLKAQ